MTIKQFIDEETDNFTMSAFWIGEKKLLFG